MSPLRSPSSGASLLPSVDTNDQYIVSLRAIDEKPVDPNAPPRYNADGTQQQQANIVWKMDVYYDDGEPVLRPDGGQWQLWAFTTDSTFFDRKGGTMTARARAYIHAFAGREVEDAEIDEMIADSEKGLPEDLVGQKAIAYLRSYKGQNGDDRLGIKILLPYKSAKQKRLIEDKPKAPARSAPAPEPQPDAPMDEVDETDIPF